MIVVVHIPKTAGTTVKSLLSEEFGERLLEDYEDKPLSRGGFARNAAALRSMLGSHPQLAGRECVYGHFLPLKYARVPGARFATWLRDPVQRAMSRYHHYRRSSSSGQSPLPPDLSPAQFFRLPAFQDTYAKYLWGFPLARFEFVGITDQLDRSLSLFRRCFSLDDARPAPTLNANPAREGDTYDVAPEMRRLILNANPRDVRLYEEALRRFESLARGVH